MTVCRRPATGRHGGARLLRPAADHGDGQPVRDPRREPRRQRGPPAGLRRAEADEAQGGDRLLRRRVEEPPVFSFKARQRLDVARRARRLRRERHGRSASSASSSAPACCARPGTCRRPGIERGRHRSAARSSRSCAGSGTSSPTSATSGCRSSSTSTSSTRPAGRSVLVSERQKAIRDRYDVTVPDPRLDFRVAAAWPSPWTRCRAANRPTSRSARRAGTASRRRPGPARLPRRPGRAGGRGRSPGRGRGPGRASRCVAQLCSSARSASRSRRGNVGRTVHAAPSTDCRRAAGGRGLRLVHPEPLVGDDAGNQCGEPVTADRGSPLKVRSST